jgi:hypothetical protein
LTIGRGLAEQRLGQVRLHQLQRYYGGCPTEVGEASGSFHALTNSSLLLTHGKGGVWSEENTVMMRHDETIMMRQ